MSCFKCRPILLIARAKQKVQPEVFEHLSAKLVADFYELYGEDEEVRWWHGHRLIGGDGTRLNLPETEELRARFGVNRNQHQGKSYERVQATALVLHDLLNDVGLRAVLGAAHSSEKRRVI